MPWDITSEIRCSRYILRVPAAELCGSQARASSGCTAKLPNLPAVRAMLTGMADAPDGWLFTIGGHRSAPPTAGNGPGRRVLVVQAIDDEPRPVTPDDLALRPWPGMADYAKPR
jgi:hypothetical protein